MKKAFSIFLIAAMLFTCTLASADMQTNSFVFRNGIVWGMSQKEVTASESTKGQAYALNDLELLQYLNVSMSKFTATLFYVFDDSQLSMAGYMVESGSQETFDYLGSALCQVYGSTQTEIETEFIDVLNYLNPSLYTEEEVAGFPMALWTTPDGTDIWMVWENVERSNVVEVIYVSPAVKEKIAQKNAFNTNGL